MCLVIHKLAMRPRLTHKHVQSVVPLSLAPLLHLWLRPLDLLSSDAFQVRVCLPPLQNTNCLPETAWSSSTERFSKRLSNPLYYHSFTSWSGWPAVWLLQTSLHRQQNSALIKISWRWMSHIKTASFVGSPWLSRQGRVARADVSSHHALYYFCIGSD